MLSERELKVNVENIYVEKKTYFTAPPCTYILIFSFFHWVFIEYWSLTNRIISPSFKSS